MPSFFDAAMDDLLGNPNLLADHIRTRLSRQFRKVRFSSSSKENKKTAAAICFLLGVHPSGPGRPPEPCFIFNQRSLRVRQPGDLCFPGGGVSPLLDHLLSGLLKLPGFPLFRWSPERNRSSIPKDITYLLATCLRESFEEMGLNPLRTEFLGPMAPEHFKRFNRLIYPMVVWSNGQKKFRPNWEVDKIVYFPIRHFFHHGSYGKLPFSNASHFDKIKNISLNSAFPCITYRRSDNVDLLWGLTFRIVMRFLNIVFDFQPPDTASLPVLSNNGRK